MGGRKDDVPSERVSGRAGERTSWRAGVRAWERASGRGRADRLGVNYADATRPALTDRQINSNGRSIGGRWVDQRAQQGRSCSGPPVLAEGAAEAGRF